MSEFHRAKFDHCDVTEQYSLAFGDLIDFIVIAENKPQRFISKMEISTHKLL